MIRGHLRYLIDVILVDLIYSLIFEYFNEDHSNQQGHFSIEMAEEKATKKSFTKHLPEPTC
jgi:hypothetical protein